MPFQSWRVARDQVLAALLAGQRQLMVTGQPGTGKTLLLHDISRILRAAGWEAEMYRPSFSGDAGVAAPISGKPGVLLVDEADHLRVDALDEVIASTGCAILLAGLDRLAGACPGWARVKLAPLTMQDGREFVALWLRQGGLPATAIDDEVAARAVELSEGVPRLLARLLSGALWLADSQGEALVSVLHVEDAARLRTALAGPDTFDNPSDTAAEQTPAQAPAPIIVEHPVPPATDRPLPAVASAVPVRVLQSPVARRSAPADIDPVRPRAGKVWYVVAAIGLIAGGIVVTQKYPAIRTLRTLAVFTAPVAPPEPSAVETANPVQAPAPPMPPEPASASVEPASPAAPALAEPRAAVAPEPDPMPVAAIAASEPALPVAPAVSIEPEPANPGPLVPPSPPQTIETADSNQPPGAAAPDPGPQMPAPPVPSVSPPVAEAIAEAPGQVVPPLNIVPATSPVVPTLPPPNPALPAQQVPAQKLPAATLVLLLQRGDQMIALGDVSAARLLYGRAASAGSGVAALAMGRTFDPNFLASIGAGVAPDPMAATIWYRLAITLGDKDAIPLLQQIEGHKPAQ